MFSKVDSTKITDGIKKLQKFIEKIEFLGQKSVKNHQKSTKITKNCSKQANRDEIRSKIDFSANFYPIHAKKLHFS